MQKWLARCLLKRVKKDYSKIAAEFASSRLYSWREFDSFLPYIKNGDRVADVGCGSGRFYKYLKNIKDVDYVGIDNNRNLIKIAEKNHPEAEFKLGDLLDLPLNGDSQDVIISIAALHHVPSKNFRERAVKEMHRVLKKRGIIIITVWNLFQRKYIKYVRKARLRQILSLGAYDKRDTFIPWGKSGIKRYYYAFNQGELQKLLKKYFQIIEKDQGNNLLFICRKI